MALQGTLYVAGPFDTAALDKITEHFSRLLGQGVSFDLRRDEKLIGGFLAMVDGKIYDSSVAAELNALYRHMLDKE